MWVFKRYDTWYTLSHVPPARLWSVYISWICIIIPKLMYYEEKSIAKHWWYSTDIGLRRLVGHNTVGAWPYRAISLSWQRFCAQLPLIRLSLLLRHRCDQSYGHLDYSIITVCSSAFGAMQFSIDTSVPLRPGVSPDIRARTTKTGVWYTINTYTLVFANSGDP